jgi:hypothetical protein
MATTPINDLIVTKLKTRWPNRPKNFADLWLSYSAQNNGGAVDVNGVPTTKGKYFLGALLRTHYGGTEATMADKAERFWTAFVP